MNLIVPYHRAAAGRVWRSPLRPLLAIRQGSPPNLGSAWCIFNVSLGNTVFNTANKFFCHPLAVGAMPARLQFGFSREFRRRQAYLKIAHTELGVA